MKKSPHKIEHKRSRAIREANREETGKVLPSPVKILPLKKDLIPADFNSPKKVKRAKSILHEMHSFEKIWKEKQSRKKGAKTSKRTTPKVVDYKTTKASAHSQKELRQEKLVRTKNNSNRLRLRIKLQRRK